MWFYSLLLVVMLIGVVRFAMKSNGKWFLTIPYIMTVLPLWYLTEEKLPLYEHRIGLIVFITILLISFRYIYKQDQQVVC
jgi:hypothetical protein